MLGRAKAAVLASRSEPFPLFYMLALLVEAGRHVHLRIKSCLFFLAKRSPR
jgi:hypothetical protein